MATQGFKTTLTNNGNTIIYFNYRRLSDGMYFDEVPLLPQQTKRVWHSEGSLVIDTPNPNISQIIISFPPTGTTTTTTISPTPTPTGTTTPTPTPTGTTTPTPTPTGTTTPTPTETPTGTTVPTPTPSETPTGTTTPTPTSTPTPTQNVWSHDFKYSPDDYLSACTNSATTYYTSNNQVYGQTLYTDLALTNIAPTGYYIVVPDPCADSFGNYGYSSSVLGTINGSISYAPCVNYIYARYDSGSTTNLCVSSPYIMIYTSADVQSLSIGDIFYQNTSYCIPASDGYYSACDCGLSPYDYFLISGGTGEVVYIQNCPTPTPTPTPI